MKEINAGLVLEGGGMRGLFTSGVLDFFLENNLHCTYVIGVSAGACNGLSYVSKQIGRSKAINIDYINDKRYMSINNLIKEGSLFGMDFIFNDIALNLNPLDYETFFNSKTEFVVVTTNYTTGSSEYFSKNKDCDFIMEAIKASMSLPLISRPIKIKDSQYLDGGVVDPIPIKKAIEDGNTKNIVILTQPTDYRKECISMKTLLKAYYYNNKNIYDKLLSRHICYNETLDFIKELEEQNNVFVIRPSGNIKINRIEKDLDKIEALYNEGYEIAQKTYNDLLDWLQT